MVYRLEVIDATTGVEKSWEVDADSDVDALRKAKAAGFFISSLQRVLAPDILPVASAPTQPIPHKREALLRVVKGSNGQIELYPEKIRISRSGGVFEPLRGRGEKDIRIDSITGVQLNLPSLFSPGFVKFVFEGSQDWKGVLRDLRKDENAVMFGPIRKAEFLSLRGDIEYIRIAVSAKAPPASSRFDDLERLSRLRERGALNDDEFQDRKRRLLADFDQEGIVSLPSGATPPKPTDKRSLIEKIQQKMERDAARKKSK